MGRYLRPRMDTSVSIYAMSDALTSTVYVGATSGPIHYRKATHIADAFTRKYGTRKVATWVHDVISAGRDIDIVPLECVPPGGDWQDAERFYVSQFRALGLDLANDLKGGLGGPMTDAIRAKISAAQKGRKRPPEVIAKMRAGWMAYAVGRKLSQATKDKISASHLARRAQQKFLREV